MGLIVKECKECGSDFILAGRVTLKNCPHCGAYSSMKTTRKSTDKKPGRRILGTSEEKKDES
jgi:predicted  nucleic acid-binding Zn-ribbon protein